MIREERLPDRYPGLYTADNEGSRAAHGRNARRRYGIISYVLLFFLFSFAGWVWEVLLHFFRSGVFVNRGTMLGPWLPIYGTGGVAVIALLRKWSDNRIITFILTVTVCCAVEYFTSWYLEYTRGMRWWDYSGSFVNLNGRICLAGAAAFGIGGCAAIYIIGPAADDFFKRFSKKTEAAVCILLVLLFAADFAYSYKHPNTGRGITDYASNTAAGKNNSSQAD